ncbi:MAG: hypothetical protein LKJ86_07380 [Oscillibacter sp.]|jgi:hypothetical protein|nr:hypothetical protein [Oscillibacter sp.]
MLQCFSQLNPQWLNRAFVYTGSVGPLFHDFRYRWTLDGENKLVHAATYSKICFEKADDVVTRDFAWDDAGIEEMKQWLQSQYEAFAGQSPVES